MKKILIVEDDRELNEGIAFHIKKTGYQPIQTYDLRTAGLMFREEKPDLILLDVAVFRMEKAFSFAGKSRQRKISLFYLLRHAI